MFTPMCTIPLPRWIVDAAARFSHRRGAVSQEAEQTDCSRQTVYDHGRKVLTAVALEHSGGPTRKQLVEQIETLRQENVHLSNQLKEAILFPEAKQQEFSAKGRSMGISLDQIGVLLVVLLGREVAPARLTIERWVQAAEQRRARSSCGLLPSARIWCFVAASTRSSSAGILSWYVSGR